MKSFTIGVDFGTLSVRAVLLDCADGSVLASEEYKYPHGVISGPNSAAFQDPQDYLEGLQKTVRAVACHADGRILGLGIDFTACTALPVDKNLEPLALAKLWKSHSAQSQADRITALCEETGISLSHLGGKVSSEWLLPKLLETLEETPEVYRRAAWFLEAGDWLVWKLTGTQIRSSSMAGFKGQWTGDWLSEDFLRRLHPELTREKLAGQVRTAGSAAGTLSPWGAEFLGLSRETCVATAIIDAQAGVPSGGLCRPGDLMLILGTSGCHELLSDVCRDIPGVMGRVQDGILPGLYAYETSQCAMGDLFGWFMDNCVPYTYYQKAVEQGLSVFDYMESLAAKTETSLVALDWWNGSRSPYANAQLTGAIFGFTLATRPEEIYRALLESLAFSTRQILDLYRQGGVPVKRIHACGGIAVKNRLFMQILCDVLDMPIQVMDREPSCAIGSAILAAWAAGIYETPQAAVEALAAEPGRTYTPAHTGAYRAKLQKYLSLAEEFAAKKPIAF